jgi:hypothetical protein
VTSPFELGREDALAGRTACPFAVPYDARRWELGYEKQRDETPGLLPRFGALRRRLDRRDRLL